MKVEIEKLKQISEEALISLEFSKKEAKVVADHVVDAECLGRKSHGIYRIIHFKKKIETDNFNPRSNEPIISKETGISLKVEGNGRSGMYVIDYFLNYAISKAKENNICLTASNSGVNTGLIGIYARKAAEQGLIYLGFHNSTGGLIPHGSIKDIWGTNPLTVGIPSNNLPIILDFASTKITYGDVLQAMQQGTLLPENSVLDEKGNPSDVPQAAWDGGILPIAGHKGSGLAMIVELLAGGLSNGRVGYDTNGGWGSFYILINPEIFRPLEEFKDVVSTAISELKTAPKAKDFKEIYFPGEQSQLKRLKSLKDGFVDVDENLLKEIKSLINS